MHGLQNWSLALKNTNEIELKATPRFKIGDFVRWYESYADGFLGRDAGWGIIQEVRHHAYHGDYFTYGVLRNKHGDVMHFAEDYIEYRDEFETRMEEMRKQREQETDDSVRS